MPRPPGRLWPRPRVSPADGTSWRTDKEGVAMRRRAHHGKAATAATTETAGREGGGRKKRGERRARAGLRPLDNCHHCEAQRNKVCVSLLASAASAARGGTSRHTPRACRRRPPNPHPSAVIDKKQGKEEGEKASLAAPQTNASFVSTAKGAQELRSPSWL